jgi:hypothetical protein
VSTGLHAAAVGGDEWQLNMHPPEEDSKMVSDAIDSTLKIEETIEKAHESDFLAEKQKLLNAELAKVHQMAGHSFLQGPIRRTADYSVVLNAPEETATDVRSALRALRTVEANKERSAMADYVADKQRLLAAEISKIHHIAGH